MAMQMKLQMRMSQQLIMTPQLQQAIKLLQLSRAELEELIDQTLIENPVLEESMDIDTFPSQEEPAPEPVAEGEEVPEVISSTESFESARELEREETNSNSEEIDWQNYMEQMDQYGSFGSRPASLGDDEELPSLEATLAQTQTLADHLLWQLDMLDLDPLEYRIAYNLIGNIEEDGYLVASIQELLESQPDLHDEILSRIRQGDFQVTEYPSERFAQKYQRERVASERKQGKSPAPPVFEEEDDENVAPAENPQEVVHEVACFVEGVLQGLQEFDPNGVGARSLQECLLIQLRLRGEQESLAYRVVEQDMELLESKDLKRIARRQKEDLEQVIEAYKLIMSLEPKPGRSFVAPPAHHYIIPDVYIYQQNGDLKVALNGNGIPRLRISSYYRDLCDTMEEDGNLTKEYIQEKIKAGQWLMKSIEQRQKTIYRVTKSILKFQREFFERGIHFLKPLVLKDVAEDIQVHESTVSRITTNKYVHTPQGIFELKYFFTSGIDQGEGEAVSSKRIKDMIQQLVQNENLRNPYTDLQIAEILHRRSGIKVARRTVAKYREALNILPSNKRKQLF
ncbi:MAG: RNA polymerase factor sigma-54 [bacterium]